MPHFSGFSWGKSAADGGGQPVVKVLIVLVAAIGAALVMKSLNQPEEPKTIFESSSGTTIGPAVGNPLDTRTSQSGFSPFALGVTTQERNVLIDRELQFIARADRHYEDGDSAAAMRSYWRACSLITMRTIVIGERDIPSARSTDSAISLASTGILLASASQRIIKRMIALNRDSNLERLLSEGVQKADNSMSAFRLMRQELPSFTDEQFRTYFGANSPLLTKRGKRLSDAYGPAIALRLINGEIWIGMTDEMFREAKGKPTEINRSVYAFGIHEQWVYERKVIEYGTYGAHLGTDSKYYYFEDGILTSWQESE